MCEHGSGTPVYEHCSRYGTMNAVRVAQFLFFVLVENIRLILVIRLTLVIFHFFFRLRRQWSLVLKPFLSDGSYRRWLLAMLYRIYVS